MINTCIQRRSTMKYNSGLSENEWYIMQVLWEKSPSTLREICDALKGSKGWTKHAISSFLKRMLEKGAVEVDDSGKVKGYSAIWNKEDTILEETSSILERIYRGDLLLMVSNAIKEQKLSSEEIEELKSLLDDMK